jgi:predicted dehydrogenase
MSACKAWDGGEFMPVRQVKVGIIGLGRSGWDIHVRTLLRPMLQPLYRVVAVTDPIRSRVEEAQQQLGCRALPDYEALVQDAEVELVVVASLSRDHARHAIAALRAGKHVLCEKPMATSLADADAMVRAAEEAGRILTVNQQMRYLPDTRKVLEVVSSGKLGRILLVRLAAHSFGRRWDWQTLKEFGGGMLNNWGAHLIDLGLLFLKGEPQVFCQLENTPLYCGGDAEDHVKVVMYAPGQPLIDVEITHACAFPQERWLVMGTQGSLTGSPQRLTWKYFDHRLLEPRTVSKEPTPDRSYNQEDLPLQEEIWERSRDTTTGYELLYLDLHESIVQGKPPVITAESVRRQIAVLEECRRQSPLYAGG